MKRLLVALLLSVPFLSSAAWGEPPIALAETAEAVPKPPPVMKQYWFVMLKKGPERDQPADEAERIQAGHMANIQSYAERGQLQIAGPFMDDGQWRGIFILDVPDRAAAEAMCADDPAVKAGRLVCEIHPWLSQTGRERR
jgi:uncharacterized protein YciI